MARRRNLTSLPSPRGSPYATARAAARQSLRPLGPGRSEVILQEGKYHQVRRMLAARGMPVTYLRRDAEGGLTLQGLPRGAVRPLTEPEIAALESRQDDETFSS